MKIVPFILLAVVCNKKEVMKGEEFHIAAPQKGQNRKSGSTSRPQKRQGRAWGSVERGGGRGGGRDSGKKRLQLLQCRDGWSAGHLQTGTKKSLRTLS